MDQAFCVSGDRHRRCADTEALAPEARGQRSYAAIDPNIVKQSAFRAESSGCGSGRIPVCADRDASPRREA
jgi:hypothetical protein